MNGHDFTREQNMEARMMLAVARRGLAAAINDAENGIGHLSCDDPKIMEQVRAHWRRLYDTYMNADAIIADLESCARHLTDGDKWEPNPIADGMKPMEMAEGCACFIAETPDRVLIIPSEPTPGENTAKRLANTLNALTGDVLLDATGIRLLGTQFLFAYHGRLDRPVDHGVNLAGMRFPDRLGLLDRAERYPGFLPLRPVVANGTGALERSGRELWAGHDFTREQNMEARMMLAVARRGLAAAINDAENGIGHLSCDDPKIMEQVRAHWRRLYDTYMNADAIIADLESCARHLTDGDKWEPNPIADGMKPMEMAEGCACFIAETPDRVLIIPSEPTPGENTAKRLANTLNALTGDVLLDATGIRLLGTQFLFAYHGRLDRPVDHGVNLAGMRFPDRLGLLDRAERYPGFLPLRPVVANGTGALERSGRELWAITARTLGRLPHGRFCVDLTMFADRPRILERFAVRYGKYLKGNRTALDVTIIDPTGLVARHVATIKPKWD